MKRNAIIRIVLYSLLILLLCGILVSALGIGLFMTDNDNYTVSSEGSVDAAGIKELSIDWAAGSINIVTGETDRILLSESGEFSEKYRMAFEVEDEKLSIKYSRESVRVGFGFSSVPVKDLTVTVPKDWHCNELELDAAAVEMSVDGLSVGNLELDCASGQIRFNGAVDTADCDGAAMELTFTCTNSPSRFDIDGAACELMLTLPSGTGYSTQMDGVGCSFNSDAAYTGEGGNYKYGNESCKVLVDGLGSEITINIAKQ